MRKIPDYRDKGKPVFRLDMLEPLDRLLVQSIRVDLNTGANLSDLEGACRSVDNWDALVFRASYQGVIGWIHEALLMTEKGLVPAEIMENLRLARISYTARIASVAANLTAMMGALSEAGVDHILLKGPFLSEHVYPRSDLRYFTDIDLLIRQADVEEANEALMGINFQPVDYTDNRGFFDQGRTQAHYYRERSLPLDLHWELVNLPTHDSALKVDMEEIWRSAMAAQVAGIGTQILSAEDVLLFQCLHMTAHHDFNRLLWFKDVEQVVKRFGKDIDWDLFTEKCSRYGLKTFVYYSILMASEACGDLDVPAKVMNDLKPGHLTARLFERLARKTNILEMQSNRRRPAIEVWQLMRDDRAQRWRAIAHRFFPEARWYLECYPFLPKLKHPGMYYGIYPALMVLRAIKQPITSSEWRETITSSKQEWPD
jgi:hypothetical protein